MSARIDSLQGKVAVITGAGSGFGREFARIAAAEGMALVLVDVQADALAEVVAELDGTDILHRTLDVTDGAAMDTLAADTFDRFGVVHLLFNNAGVGSTGLLWEATTCDWEWVLGVNLWGAIHGVRTFVPRMLDGARDDPAYSGRVINTASMAGLIDPPLMGPYNVAKHAVVSLSETLHQDLSLVTDRIGCSVLCPSWVATGIARSHRNRPHDDPTRSRAAALGAAMVEKAIASARVTAVDVARLTFDAIAHDRFWILPHPEALDGVRARAAALVDGDVPADPYAAIPHLRQQLVAALRAPS